jgi:soluble lytic murein transglycosylase-like protein
MDRSAAVLVMVLCAMSTVPARAEIYAYVNPDASLLLTNRAAGNLPALWIMRSEESLEAVSKPPKPESRERYQREVQAIGSEYGVDIDLIHAVIATESNYVSTAVSAKGAVGLMQLMPLTAKRYGVVNLFDAVENIRAGVQYLRHLSAAFNGDIELVLAAYNAGEHAVLKYGRKVPPFQETKNYVRAVRDAYQGRKRTVPAARPARPPDEGLGPVLPD